MEITSFTLVMALVLLLLPGGLLYLYDRQLLAKGVVSVCRMLVQVGLGGLLVYFVCTQNRVWLTFVGVGVLAAAASFVVVRRGKLPWRLLLAVFAAQLMAALAIGICLLGSLKPSAAPFVSCLSPLCLLPVEAILMGHATSVLIRGLAAWQESMEADRPHYEYLRGNGASRLRALSPIIRKSLQGAMAPSLANLRAMGAFTLPLLFCGLLLGGLSPLHALTWTLLLVVGCMASSVLALVLALWLCHGQHSPY